MIDRPRAGTTETGLVARGGSGPLAPSTISQSQHLSRRHSSEHRHPLHHHQHQYSFSPPNRPSRSKFSANGKPRDAAMTTPALINPLLLTIRFSASIPDLDLDIPSPRTTTVLSLKHLLRTRLATRNRLRLIYQGRILPDSSALSSVLKQPPPPPPPASSSTADTKGKGKGKAVEGAPVRIYVNCSIGDELSPRELADEESSAANPPHQPDREPPNPAGRAAPRPRGFDRLLQAGFTSSEVSTLRTQFASIQTERFTPDSLPSPDSMRRLEDAWIDNNAGELPSAANPLEDELSNMSTVLDVLIRGMMIGFFFPLGSITWLLRQGLWSEKWQIFVGSGVVLSVTVGIVMGISGDR
ncbi:putative protein family UPF0645, transmembrane [Metarhizium album ARSEF 1941]|uniref:Ubiquitin-like domain-containing protein n=1 Tax=Metarhizium album (strain ARSEF 1941) TaxID=1081103 RepID=A0A0B2WNF5_METAS|nr:putative protein family UPF0645, transmembrane [Metarhizium album ARSEF 1941]KHN95493.1 putative protein family UPF0645, transmembrane [Metarhizium album ARSEF 1941]